MGMRPQRRAWARGDTGALAPLRGRTYAHGRRHCSALRVPPAKEKKSLTAKAAEDAKGTTIRINPEREREDNRLGFLLNFHTVHMRDGIKRVVNRL